MMTTHLSEEPSNRQIVICLRHIKWCVIYQYHYANDDPFSPSMPQAVPIGAQVSKHPADIKALNIELASETFQLSVAWVVSCSPNHRSLLNITKVDHPQRDSPVHRWGMFFSFVKQKSENCSCLTNQTTCAVPFLGEGDSLFSWLFCSIPATTLCTKLTIQVGRLWISLGDHFIRWVHLLRCVHPKSIRRISACEAPNKIFQTNYSWSQVLRFVLRCFGTVCTSLILNGCQVRS